MQKLKFVLILLIASFLLSSAAYADDTYYSKQWYLDSIKAPDAWKITKGSEAVVVAVIDTGVDIRNPDLAGNIWVNSDEIPNNKIDDDRNGFIDDINGWNFVEDVADPTPVVTTGYNSEAISHGTFIAGLISAKHDNNYGIKGITDKVKIMGLRGLDSKGIGDSETVSKAINYAIDNGAQIINLSFGGTDKNGELKAAIENANRWGILVVAAAGNGAAGKN